MNSQSELAKLLDLLAHIQDSYAAEVSEGVFWKRRFVRFELERMIEECELPILWERVA